MKWLRAVLLLISVLLASLIVIFPQWAFTKVWPSAARLFPHWYFRTIARLIGLKVEIKGGTEIKHPCLLVANHGSWLDIIILSTIAPMCFVAKKEVANWPLFGTLATIGRTIYVDRERRQDVGRSMATIRQRLMNGEVITLFPEGTSSDGNRVLPFRSALLGAADMQIRGIPVDVLPVTIVYSGVYGIPLGRVRRPIFAWHGDMDLPSHLAGVALAGPFEATVILHELTNTSAVGGRKELAKYCESLIRRSLAAELTGRQPTLVPILKEMS